MTDLIVCCLGELAVGTDSRAERRAEAFAVLDPIYWQAEQADARKKDREPDHEASTGRARRDADMSLLVVEPLRWALALEPDFIACEQVPGVLGLWTVVCTILAARGWSTWAGVLSSERYGVPQTRERAILMASRKGPVAPPHPTHQRYVPGEPARHEDTFDGEVLPWVSMADALGWQGVGHMAKKEDREERVAQGAGNRPRPLTSPAATLDTRTDLARWGGVDVPAPTVTAGGANEAKGHGVEPFARGGRQRIARARATAEAEVPE